MLRSCISALLLFAIVSCGGTDDGQISAPQIVPDPPSTPDTSPTTWQEGVFSTSANFHQVCADPSKAYDQINVVQGTSVDENNWLRSFINETYLWYDEIVDRDPACCSTPDYFNLMRTFETTASGNPKDRFSYSANTKEFLDSQRGVRIGYGFLFSRTQEGFFILHVEPNSPADNAGLRRGMQILEIDGIPIEQALSTLPPSKFERREFTILIPGDPQPYLVTMISTEIVESPVLGDILVDRNSGYQVGYMLFNSHIPVAEPDLISFIEYFDLQDIDELVLDLRYNGGGVINIANQLAFMVAGSQATENKLFTKIIHNDKLPSESHPFLSYNTNNLALPSLNLERVFVLTSPRTCSASELIINSLRGIDVEVILIGETTCGKPYGFSPEENCGTLYFPIQVRFVNDRGFGSYEDGIRPTCLVRGDDITHQLGDPEEARLKKALDYMQTAECLSSRQATISSEKPNGSPAKASSNQLKSIDLIETWPPIIPRAIID